MTAKTAAWKKRRYSRSKGQLMKMLLLYGLLPSLRLAGGEGVRLRRFAATARYPVVGQLWIEATTFRRLLTVKLLGRYGKVTDGASDLLVARRLALDARVTTYFVAFLAVLAVRRMAISVR
jgi:hypothetical protein